MSSTEEHDRIRDRAAENEPPSNAQLNAAEFERVRAMNYAMSYPAVTITSSWQIAQTALDELRGAVDEIVEETIADQEPSTKPRVLPNEQYVLQLIAQTGRRISRADRDRLAALEKRTQINQEFFACEEEEHTSASVPRAQDLVTLQRLITRKRNQHITDLETRLRARKEELRRRMVDTYAKHLEMIALVREIQNLGKRQTVAEAIEATKQCVFWKFTGAQDGDLSWISGDAIIRYVNDKQGIDWTTNLGQFKLTIRGSDQAILIQPFSGNTRLKNGYYHPHISGESFCWGTASDEIVEAQAYIQFERILQLAQSILCSYNPDSPYVRLEEFVVKQRPELLAGETHYRVSDRAWVDSSMLNDTPNEIRDERHNDEGDTRYLVRTYLLANKEYGVRVNESVYVLLVDGSYQQLGEGDIYEWY